AVSFLGGVDILVNNAGGYDTTAFVDLSPTTFDDVLCVSVRAPMILTQLAAKNMRTRNEKGAIVNISSISGLRPYPCRVAHSTAKAALNMLTQTTALELAPYGIRVNAICPGGVPYDAKDTYADMIPLGRDGKPEDIAKAALFLASDDASWMTGHIMVIDGGQGLSF
ncbi:MAG: SDR family oxidoreductase, partial [Alphaproteobacteria bacterium]|nr:SDR family oxidoreductase [Alphaproteobacteria bacterium]